MLKLRGGTLASSYIIRRFGKQEIKNEPFSGFHARFVKNLNDLAGVGAVMEKYKSPGTTSSMSISLTLVFSFNNQSSTDETIHLVNLGLWQC